MITINNQHCCVSNFTSHGVHCSVSRDHPVWESATTCAKETKIKLYVGRRHRPQFEIQPTTVSGLSFRSEPPARHLRYRLVLVEFRCASVDSSRAWRRLIAFLPSPLAPLKLFGLYSWVSVRLYVSACVCVQASHPPCEGSWILFHDKPPELAKRTINPPVEKVRCCDVNLTPTHIFLVLKCIRSA